MRARTRSTALCSSRLAGAAGGDGTPVTVDVTAAPLALDPGSVDPHRDGQRVERAGFGDIRPTARPPA